MEDDEIVVMADIREDSNKKSKKKTKNKKEKDTNSKKKKTKNKKVNNIKGQVNKTKSDNKKNKVRTATNAQNMHKQKVKRIIAITIISIILFVVILTSSIFDIKKINVIGNEKLSPETVISFSKLQLHTNIFKFNKSEIINNIKENAYIENISLKRKFPSTIEITIEERIVKYMLEYADGYAYINNQGYILEISNERLSVPILTGYSTDISNIKVGERIIVKDLEKMDMVIKIFETARSNELGDLITKIDISNEKNYKITLDTEGKIVYLGDCSDLNTKILYLSSILEKSAGKKGEIFLNVDLNTENAYFRPSSN